MPRRILISLTANMSPIEGEGDGCLELESIRASPPSQKRRRGSAESPSCPSPTLVAAILHELVAPTRSIDEEHQRSANQVTPSLALLRVREILEPWRCSSESSSPSTEERKRKGQGRASG